MAEPCGAALVAKALAPLVLVFGLGEQSQSDKFWRVYRDALADVPRIALERAVNQYAKTGKFFPKPAELLELANPHTFALKQAAMRSEAATRQAIEAPKRAEPSPEDKARVSALMAEFKALVKTKEPPRPAHKPISGPVDGQGLTKAGRAILERMRANGYSSGNDPVSEPRHVASDQARD